MMHLEFIRLKPRNAPGMFIARSFGGSREQRKSCLRAALSLASEIKQRLAQSLPLPPSQALLSEAAVSFSHARGSTWGVWACGCNPGIDVAYVDEFSPDYPLSRVFDAGELRMATLASGHRLRAAALLWSAKEAAAKAAGTGFAHHEPIAFRCILISPSGSALALSMGGAFSCKVHTIPLGKDGWVSVAWAGANSVD